MSALAFSEETRVGLRFLIADDNEFVRMIVRTLLTDMRDWQICGEAANGREAIAKVGELSPDIVILDLTMPVMNGFEAAKQIRRIAPSTKIVLFSVHELLRTVAEVGADAFVSKASSAQELIAAIERVIGEPQKHHTTVMVT
jgi:DNA-binding NarL/FixJ family response regulator